MHVEGIPLLNRASSRFRKTPAQRSVREQAREPFYPLVLGGSQKAVRAVLHQRAIDANRRRNHRHTARHELDRLETALPLRPLVVRQWIDTDVARVEESDFVRERPGSVIDRHAW